MFHKRLLHEFRENRKMIEGMVASQWLMLLANAALMMETAKAIAAVFEGTWRREQAGRLLFVLLAVCLIRGAASWTNSRLSFETSRQLKEKLRGMIYEKLMRLGSGYRESVGTSEAVQISTEGVEQLEIYFGKYVPQFFYSMLAPITLFILVGTMSLRVAAVLLVCVPLIPMSIVAVQKFAKKMLAKYWGTYTELGDSFLECLQGLTTLKIYQADGRYAKKMDEESEKFRKVTMRVLIMQLNSISIMDLVAYGGAGLGIILSILELQKGTVTLAECFFMIMISAEFFLPLRLLGSFFHIAMNGNAAADKIFRLLDQEETKKGDKVLSQKEQEVTLSDITFSYDGIRPVLQHVTIHAQKGLTALVGESGCGKSTITSLIMGQLIPDMGRVCIGNTKITELAPEELYRTVTRIRHDSYLFAGTVGDNLRMARPNASDEELYRALSQVHMDEFVKENGGLSMELQEKAANLSGGQKQRIALARALLHDSDIYILDEATSNVDVESENAIMAAVKRLAERKTVLLISHRLANVTGADRIYVMREGRIVEEGTHQTLLEQNGYYERLYGEQMQLEQYGRKVKSCEA